MCHSLWLIEYLSLRGRNSPICQHICTAVGPSMEKYSLQLQRPCVHCNMNETSNVGPRHYWIFNTRAGEDDLFNFIRSPEQYIPIRLFFFYEPSQYDMIHDRKNQTQASFFTRGANLSNPNIQLVKVYSVPNSLSHRKCLWNLSSLLVTWTWLYASQRRHKISSNRRLIFKFIFNPHFFWTII